jgi:membrane protease YdiL (CAAX protease family)
VSSPETIKGSHSADAEWLAPLWHTAALLAVMIAVPLTGMLLSGHDVASASARRGTSRLTAVYGPLLIVNWGLLVYVCRVGRPRSALSKLLGTRPRTVRQTLTDLGLAVTAGVLIEGSEVLAARVFGAARSDAVLAILPSSTLEHWGWMVVAVSVGFCEEVVYRGYLRAQLAAFTGSTPLAVVIQGVLFGMAHGEQGFGSASRLAIYGIGLGALAVSRRSLVPGILCHIALDLLSGVGP